MRDTLFWKLYSSFKVTRCICTTYISLLLYTGLSSCTCLLCLSKNTYKFSNWTRVVAVLVQLVTYIHCQSMHYNFCDLELDCGIGHKYFKENVHQLWTYITSKVDWSQQHLAVDNLAFSVLVRKFIPSFHSKLEALRERSPPWPRQIITPILPTVKCWA